MHMLNVFTPALYEVVGSPKNVGGGGGGGHSDSQDLTPGIRPYVNKVDGQT